MYFFLNDCIVEHENPDLYIFVMVRRGEVLCGTATKKHKKNMHL